MTEIDEKIKNANKQIAKHLAVGILKISAGALPVLLFGASLGTGIWADVQFKQSKKDYNAFKSDESYIAAQEEEIATLDSRYQNSEIAPKEYQENLDYIYSDEHFEKYMSTNEQFQALLKSQKKYRELAFGLICGGGGIFGLMSLAVLGHVFGEGIATYDFEQAEKYMKKKEELIPLKRKEKLGGEEAKEKLPDLGEEFYKTNENL